MACKSAVAVQLSGPHTELTPAVPWSRKGWSRGSPQKQGSLTVLVTGGVQAPWTSKRCPQREAQAGSVEKGTMRPLGDATAPAAEVVACGVAVARERKLLRSRKMDEGRILIDGVVKDRVESRRTRLRTINRKLSVVIPASISRVCIPRDVCNPNDVS
jgi:hypothetical protein